VRDVSSALPLRGKNIAFLLSVSAHLAVGLALARAGHRPTVLVSPAQRALVEITAVELVADRAAEVAHSQPAIFAPPESHGHSLTPRPAEASARPLLPAPNASDSSALAAPAVVDSPAPAAPHFAMTAGAQTQPSGNVTTTDSQAPVLGSGAAEQPLPEASVDTAASLLAGGAPSYPPEAEVAGVEADVPLEVVVDAAGAVIGARVLTHVGYGLDEAALRGVRAYRFSPARRAGKALAVRMRWLMRFQLR